jgi:excisionase family DNA binding protein
MKKHQTANVGARKKAMPKTKVTPRPPKAVLVNGPIPEVLNLSEAAAYLRLPEAEVVRLIREQDLPARQVGVEWRLLLTAIRGWLGSGKSPESNKDAWMKLVGVWRDDPFFEDFLGEVNRERNSLKAENQE